MLYVVTNDLERRLFEHRSGATTGFATRYRTTRVVHFETTENPLAAIAREKEIKGWRRAKKIQLIERNNAQWCDLSRDW